MKKTVLYIAAVLAVSGGLMWQKPMVAHAEPEVQKLFEKSALVIIDVNDAIANGYVQLATDITDIMEGEADEE